MSRVFILIIVSCATACLALMAWNVAGTYEIKRVVMESLMNQRVVELAGQKVETTVTVGPGQMEKVITERYLGETEGIWLTRHKKAIAEVKGR